MGYTQSVCCNSNPTNHGMGMTILYGNYGLHYTVDKINNTYYQIPINTCSSWKNKFRTNSISNVLEHFSKGLLGRRTLFASP